MGVLAMPQKREPVKLTLFMFITACLSFGAQNKLHLMKNVIFYLCLTILIMGCSKEFEEILPSTIVSEQPFSVDSICKSFGIFPKDMASITAIYLTGDSVSYKLAGGMKGNKSWFAKFSPDGTELYSYSLDPNIAQKKYAYINLGSIQSCWVKNKVVYKNDNKLFLVTWFTNEDPENFPTVSERNSVLSVLDFETGKEFARLPFENSTRYEINRSNDTYCVLSYKYLYCLNSNGGLEWYREPSKKEKENGFNSYHDYQMLDNKLMLFNDNPEYWGYPHFKIIDLETYELKLELSITVAGDLAGEKGVRYRFHRAEKQNDNIILYFGEYLGKEIIDDVVFGEYHYEYELKNEYYYVVAYPSGEVLGKYKK